MKIKLANFEIGQVWISKNRKKYRIVGIEVSNPVCWYPLLIEDIVSNVILVADPEGAIFEGFKSLNDKLVFKVAEDSKLTEKEEDTATRMLKVFNKRKELEEENRKKDNEKVKRSYRLIKKD